MGNEATDTQKSQDQTNGLKRVSDVPDGTGVPIAILSPRIRGLLLPGLLDRQVPTRPFDHRQVA